MSANMGTAGRRLYLAIGVVVACTESEVGTRVTLSADGVFTPDAVNLADATNALPDVGEPPQDVDVLVETPAPEVKEFRLKEKGRLVLGGIAANSEFFVHVSAKAESPLFRDYPGQPILPKFLHITRLDGTEIRRVPAGGDVDVYPTISPSGHVVLIDSGIYGEADDGWVVLSAARCIPPGATKALYYGAGSGDGYGAGPAAIDVDDSAYFMDGGYLTKIDSECKWVYLTDTGSPKVEWGRLHQPAPIIVGDYVVTSTRRQEVVMLDKATGQIVARHALSVPAAKLPMAVGPDGSFVTLGGWGVVQLNPDLSERWVWPGTLFVHDLMPLIDADGGILIFAEKAQRLFEGGLDWKSEESGNCKEGGLTLTRADEIVCIRRGSVPDDPNNPTGETHPAAILIGFDRTTGDLTREFALAEPMRPRSTMAIPRPGQVIYASERAVHSIAVPDLDIPDPEVWATAHGNNARDRRVRVPTAGASQ